MATIKESIIRYLESNPGPQYAGAIARVVAEIHECKSSNCERRMRELEDEGKIISEYVANPNGRGNKVVRYSLKPMQQPEKPMQSWRPEFLKQKLIRESQDNLL